jgi:hypothetical protein
MKFAGTMGILGLATTLALATFPPPVHSQERVCIESERDGRIVCGRRVRDGSNDNYSDRWNWRDRDDRRDGDDRDNRDCGRNFDANFYVAAYPDVALALRRRQIASACAHYLTFGRFEGRLPQFSESSYLSKNPDVAYAVRRGQFRSGYEHWLKIGRYEKRSL